MTGHKEPTRELFLKWLQNVITHKRVKQVSFSVHIFSKTAIDNKWTNKNLFYEKIIKNVSTCLWIFESCWNCVGIKVYDMSVLVSFRWKDIHRTFFSSCEVGTLFWLVLMKSIYILTFCMFGSLLWILVVTSVQNTPSSSFQQYIFILIKTCHIRSIYVHITLFGSCNACFLYLILINRYISGHPKDFKDYQQ